MRGGVHSREGENASTKVFLVQEILHQKREGLLRGP